jgi:hypothetical protein
MSSMSCVMSHIICLDAVLHRASNALAPNWLQRFALVDLVSSLTAHAGGMSPLLSLLLACLQVE